MKQDVKISTGLEGLDRSIDFLHPGDTVVWQTEHTADYIYMTNRFVTSVARSGKRIIYIRFGSNAEAIDADALAKAGANVRKYNVDPSVGFETFAVNVYRIIKSEQDNAFYIFDSLSELQNHWFSDMLICDFFCLTYPELKAHGAVAYIPIRYQRHTYETVSRIRNTTPVLINVRTVDGNLYIHPVKVNAMGGRQVRRFPRFMDSGYRYDHYFCEFTYADGSQMYSQSRQQEGTWPMIGEIVYGTKGVGGAGWLDDWEYPVPRHGDKFLYDQRAHAHLQRSKCERCFLFRLAAIYREHFTFDWQHHVHRRGSGAARVCRRIRQQGGKQGHEHLRRRADDRVERAVAGS